MYHHIDVYINLRLELFIYSKQTRKIDNIDIWLYHKLKFEIAGVKVEDFLEFWMVGQAAMQFFFYDSAWG